ncbi:MAG: cation:proton antiporter [Methylobacter sp.]|nr:cation:proton antiporter [Methylobacter sp.]MDP2099003.1 cation:proton antiporter [Methylobacter sp.]MDP2427637.1 cation:proton antiporter [Methylobacter sp.]MDP3056832.1 cation:proton antiporter [Methylobacter sp.]MDP3361247.1 cation:proton antiporter [Methylobacter sp.]
MNLDVFLSIFTLMFIALGVNLLAAKIRLPYTVLLVIVGSLLVPLSQIETLSFIGSFQLTPESLFFVFLPILIFESAYNMNFRDVKKNKYSMGTLAVLGLLISVVFIGFVGQWAFQLMGLAVPLLVTLLFGAIISSTDPVAVLSLFKEYGAPHRLTLIFEGETLFNDATSFALFMVFLDIFIHGYTGYPTILEGIFSFISALLGGIVFGLLMGFMFSKLIQFVKGNEHLEITLTLLVAHFTFILTELISEHLVILGQHIHLSSIISTLISSMVMGNYGRFKMSHGVEEYMEKFWSYFAFVANSLVFILMGLMFANLSIELTVAILPILAIILVVAVGRAVSVYASVSIINTFKLEEEIPKSWQQLLSWGSLRGALAIVMVLLIPDDLSLPDWTASYSIKDFITALTIGCIYFTLLIKATTIGIIIRKLKIDALSDQEELGYCKSKVLVYYDLLKKLDELVNHKQISAEQYQDLSDYYRNLLNQQHSESESKIVGAERVIEDMLSLFALSLEKTELKEIFRRGEINEAGYKKILNTLELQVARVKQEKQQQFAPEEYFIEPLHIRLANMLRKAFSLPPKPVDPEEVYLYYRAQYKLISKVIHELTELENSHLIEIFSDKQAIKNIYSVYQNLLAKTESHMKKEIISNQALLDHLNQQAAKNLLHDVQNDTLMELYKNEIVTTKLYILLKKELQV